MEQESRLTKGKKLLANFLPRVQNQENQEKRWNVPVL